MGQCCGRKKRSPERQHLLMSQRYGASSQVCVRCGRSVTTFEGKLDSGGRIYHSSCLRCGQCTRSLEGQSVTFRDGDIFCARHALPTPAADVQAEKTSNGHERRRFSMLSATSNVSVADICEEIGDQIVCMPPTCGGCGGVFEGNDEVMIAGMMKFHTDCGFGRAGPGRERAVVTKLPHVVAKGAQPYLALRLQFSASSTDDAVYTFYLERDARSFAAIEQLRSRGRSVPDVPPLIYNPVNDHRVKSSRATSPESDGLPARVTVLDIHGNYCQPTDGPPTVRGQMLCSSLSRLENRVLSQLNVTWRWDRTQHTLTIVSGVLKFSAEGAPTAALTSSRPTSPVAQPNAALSPGARTNSGTGTPRARSSTRRKRRKLPQAPTPKK